MGYFIGFLAALIFGSNGSVIKVLVGSGLSAAQLTFFRTLTVMMLTGLVLMVWDRRSFFITRNQMMWMFVLGVGGVAGLQYFYAVAVSRIDVGIALLFEYLAVLAVAVIARVFFKEQVRPRIWVAIALVLTGLAVVAEAWNSSVELWGMVAALIAAAAYTVYFLVGEKALTTMGVISMTFWAMTFATIFWGIFSAWWEINPALFTQNISMTGALEDLIVPLWMPLMWAVVIGSFVSFLLSFLALKKLKATPAGIVASSEVIFAFIVAWLWLGEALSLVQIMGAAIVVLGIVLAQTARPGKTVDLDLAFPEAEPVKPARK
jgi:drug/metabolite transporter (DMT)-like permease